MLQGQTNKQNGWLFSGLVSGFKAFGKKWSNKELFVSLELTTLSTAWRHNLQLFYVSLAIS